jgi:CubicO group peptidase (beta-lactamase class C family)
LATGQRNLACGGPASIGDGWPTATPESVGLAGERLCGIAARLKEAEANVHAVIIVRHGKLVFEQYFPGYDEPWGMGEGRHDFDATTKHDMRSVSKSVVSLLVGIAIDRELIKSADEPVVKFFPDYSALKTAGWDNITLRHLLTMSSGIQWDENRPWKDPQNDEPHLGNEADPFRYVLSKPIAAPPDTVWNYNGGGTDLLGNIIERVSGKSLEAFAREALFTPLGISDWEWMKYRNEHVAAAAGLRLRPRDAAKIGQLVLNKGDWNGKQIVSAKWIEQSVTPRFQALGYFGGLFFYGQQWWMGRTLSGDKDVTWIAAQGLGGQRIFIVPELDLVVMTTSGLYGSGRQGQAALDILANFIIPYIRDNNTR